MQQPIVYIDTSRVREGKLEQLEPAMQRLSRFIEDNVPRLISYAFYLDASRSEMTVVAVHPDSSSLEFHMDAGRVEFRRFADLIDLLRIEVYGHVSDAVLERLQQKAKMLGNATVVIHELYAGFSR